jgi:hypothetical protein
MEPPGLPEQLLCHVDAQAAVTLLQLTTPIRARCPQARTPLGELAATTDPNLSWIQRRPSAHERRIDITPGGRARHVAPRFQPFCQPPAWDTSSCRDFPPPTVGPVGSARIAMMYLTSRG